MIQYIFYVFDPGIFSRNKENVLMDFVKYPGPLVSV